MKVLLTNDDGISSPGLHELARILTDATIEVTILAPSNEASGSSAGVGPVYEFGRFRTKAVRIDGLEKVQSYEADALPALLVLVACMGSFGHKPDMVIAGINRGLNIGRSVMHSGTVGAALTATHFKVPALAVSIEWSEGKQHWPTAAKVALEVAEKIASTGDLRLVYNLNVPNVEYGDIKGIRLARLCSTGLITGAKFQSERNDMSLQLGGNRLNDKPDSDIELILKRYATITPIRPVSETFEDKALQVLQEIIEIRSES